MSGCKTQTDAPKDTLTQSERKTGILSVPGAKLPYFVEGEGFPCIVVSEGELVSRALSQELKKHFTFIFLNGRMNVPDTEAIQDLSFDVLAKDVEELRKTLRFKKVGVFGHSISGLIALEYSRQYPKHTAFVIMNGTIPFLDTRSSHIERCYWKTNASAERKMSFTNAWRGISRSALHKHWSSDAAKTIHTLDAAQIFYDVNSDASPLLQDTYWNMKVWSHIYGHLMPQYNLNNSTAIKVPVFLALGKEDYYVPCILWEEETVHIPNLSVNLFEKSGHYAFYEEEQLFREKLLEWIKSLNLVVK